MFRLFLAISLSVAALPCLAQSLTKRVFYTDMSAAEQTKYTESPATGSAELSVDLSNLELSWRIAFRDLTSEVTGITLHGPAQPGANGVVFLELASGGKKSPVEGKAPLNEAQVQFLLNRWAYVNVRTEKYPLGEIRGQLTAVRPEDVEN